MKIILSFLIIITAQASLAIEESQDLIQEQVQSESVEQVAVEDIQSSELKSKLESTTHCVAVIPEVTSVEIAESLSAKGYQVMGAQQALSARLVNHILFNKTSVVESGVISKHVIKSKLQVISITGSTQTVLAEENLNSVRCNDLDSRECMEKVENAHNQAMENLAGKIPAINCAK